MNEWGLGLLLWWFSWLSVVVVLVWMVVYIFGERGIGSGLFFPAVAVVQ